MPVSALLHKPFKSCAVIALITALLIGCGEKENRTLSTQAAADLRGFGCTVEFSVASAQGGEEFDITVTPYGKYQTAPVAGSLPAGFTVLTSNTSTEKVLTVHAKASYDFVFVASLTDLRGRRTQCSGGLPIEEVDP